VLPATLPSNPTLQSDDSPRPAHTSHPGPHPGFPLARPPSHAMQPLQIHDPAPACSPLILHRMQHLPSGVHLPALAAAPAATVTPRAPAHPPLHPPPHPAPAADRHPPELQAHGSHPRQSQLCLLLLAAALCQHPQLPLPPRCHLGLSGAGCEPLKARRMPAALCCIIEEGRGTRGGEGGSSQQGVASLGCLHFHNIAAGVRSLDISTAAMARPEGLGNCQLGDPGGTAELALQS